MVTEAEKAMETLHFKLHGIRMQSGYKPTIFEIGVSWIISDYFKDRCSECKSIIDSKRIEAERQLQGNVPLQNKSFMDKVLGK